MKKHSIKNILIGIAGVFILFGCTQTSDCKLDDLSNTDCPRHKVLMDFDWQFHKGEIKNGENMNLDISSWKKIDLPHDWSVEDIEGTESPFNKEAPGAIDAGYLEGGTAWYRKEFSIPSGFKKKKITIDFEGIYMNADVWLNGQHLGYHPYGYTEFSYDISDKINFSGKNILAIEVKNEGRNSRWYSGSGIYRHVWLNFTQPIHVKKWGIKTETLSITKTLAQVIVKTEIENLTGKDKEITLATTIYDKSGTIVSKQKSNHTITTETKITQPFDIIFPVFWSVENPELYNCVTEIFDSKSHLIDRLETTMGIRTLEFSVEKGFLLNGKPTLLKGGCMHHGNGPLGAAAYDRAEERRVELMKANGFNSIRCAHNPPSTAFLDACDRLGILVIDETFDMWKKQKNPQDYHLYFDEWWQRDVDAMVLRDQNHPSIIMWSIGNEIPERGDSGGVKTAQMLVDYVKELDQTRPVTSAVNGLGPDKDPYFATLDIAGLNYSFGGDHGKKSIFEIDHNRVPDRIAYCSESYPLEAFGAWMEAVDYPYVLGDYVWTGFDYLGEASIGWLGYPHDTSFYPWNHAFCGDLDLCGTKRPQSYYRDVLWNNGKQLSVFIKPPTPSFKGDVQRVSWSKWHWQDVVAEWNWEGFEATPLEVEVYSAFSPVELFLNGKSLGKKESSRKTEWKTKWKVPYESGELKAVAQNIQEETITSVLKTAQKPTSITLTADRKIVMANGQDLSYVTVNFTDKNGLLHPNTDNLIEFEISGPGEILAVASSNPRSIESFQLPKRKTYKGKCLVIIKTTNESGEIKLTAKTEGIKPSSVVLTSK